MARKLRLQYEGAIYHITARGNGRRKLFIDDEYKRLREKQGSVEDVSFRRATVLRNFEAIVKVVAGIFGVPDLKMRERMRGSLARPVAIWMLCKHAGLTQREAGRILGYKTGSAVSHQISGLKNAVMDVAKTRQMLQRVEHSITRLK